MIIGSQVGLGTVILLKQPLTRLFSTWKCKKKNNEETK